MGKAILAHLPQDSLEEILSSISFDRKTDNTIVTRLALIKELEQIRADGYAINDEELEKGLRAVAAPIFNYTGEAFAATNIAWTTARHPERRTFSENAVKIIAAAGRDFAPDGLRSRVAGCQFLPHCRACETGRPRPNGRRSISRLTTNTEGRTMQRQVGLTCYVMMGVLIGIMGVVSPSSAARKMLIGSTSASSSHYGYFVAVSQVINEKVAGIDTSVVETGATVDNLRRFARNQIDLGLVTTNVLSQAYFGRQDFKDRPVKSKAAVGVCDRPPERHRPQRRRHH